MNKEWTFRLALWWKEAGFRCMWGRCGNRAEQIHHMHPRSEGGSDEQENLIPLCCKHHSKKIHAEWRRYFPILWNWRRKELCRFGHEFIVRKMCAVEEQRRAWLRSGPDGERNKIYWKSVDWRGFRKIHAPRVKPVFVLLDRDPLRPQEAAVEGGDLGAPLNPSVKSHARDAEPFGGSGPAVLFDVGRQGHAGIVTADTKNRKRGLDSGRII